jgi:chromosome segregation ATPase
MNHILKITIATVLGLFLSYGFVLAYYHTEPFSAKRESAGSLEQQRQELKQKIEEQAETLKARQTQMRQQMQQLREAAPQATGELFSAEEMKKRALEHQERFKAERKKLHEEAQKRKEEFEARAKEMRETTKEEMERRKQEFRQKLAQLKEERHRILAEKLSENINRVNQLRSDAALRYLDALELVLGKIEARIEIVEDGTEADLTQVREAITEARQRIAEAREAVLAQKGKEYVVHIGSQETLGQDIRKVMQELRDDHRKLRQEVLHPLRNLIRDVMLALKAAVEQQGEAAQDLLHEDFDQTP